MRRAGAKDVRGFRAPIFSLTAATAWAYPVLRELGFSYSSSVLPAKNPFYGWPGFGPEPRLMEGIWELPMSVARFGPYVVPPAGGVYFRVLPRPLVLRAEEIYVDPGRPYTARLEQIYAPRVALKGSLTAKASLHKTIRVPMVGIQPGEKVKDLAAREGVSRAYVIKVDVAAKDADLGSATLAIEVSRGLDARLSALESGLKNVQGFDALRAEVLFPADHIRCANRGLIEMGTFKLEAALKAAEETLAALEAGRDPFAGRTGDMKRHYLLEEAGEIMPYRLYVPTKYDGKTAYPLIVALHGLGATEDSIFDAYGPDFLKLAEQHGTIVAAPLGYRVDGAYGRPLFAAGADERPPLLTTAETSISHPSAASVSSSPAS